MRRRSAGYPFLLMMAAGCAPAAEAVQPVAQAQANAFSLTGRIEQGGLARGRAPAGTAALMLGEAVVPLGAGGEFVIGFDRDHAAAATLTARLRDGRTISEQLEVRPRAWPTEHVDVAQRPGGATPDYLRIREGELARIRAARAVNASSEGWRQRFIWPAQGRISGVFGSQRIYRGEPGAFHTGVDVAPGAGAPVVAPADGVVLLAGPPIFSLEGNLVIIDHGMGLNSAFLHLSEAQVRQGQEVRQGQLIGRVGASGRATGPHLHWSMKWRDARIDPQVLVPAR